MCARGDSTRACGRGRCDVTLLLQHTKRRYRWMAFFLSGGDGTRFVRVAPLWDHHTSSCAMSDRDRTCRHVVQARHIASRRAFPACARVLRPPFESTASKRRKNETRGTTRQRALNFVSRTCLERNASFSTWLQRTKSLRSAHRRTHTSRTTSHHSRWRSPTIRRCRCTSACTRRP